MIALTENLYLSSLKALKGQGIAVRVEREGKKMEHRWSVKTVLLFV